MSTFSLLACTCLFATALATGAAAADTQYATSHVPPARKAFVELPGRDVACMSGRLVSHVAFSPTELRQMKPCGHLLSTDTVLTVHHWDKT